MLNNLLLGAAAGAAGTTALNTATYLDMAARGRPSSSTPEKTVEALADDVGVRIPGDDHTQQNREQGLGPLTGIAAGVGTGVLYALLSRRWRPGAAVGTVLAGATAMVAGSGPMTLLGVTDPRQWSAKAWVADVVPHLAYGAVTTATFRALDR